MTANNTRRRRIFTQPAVIVLIVIALALGIEYLLSIDILNKKLQLYIGIAVIVMALCWMTAGAILFWKYRTPILPDSNTEAIISTGPYKFSRNPLYLGLLIIQGGVAIILNNLWIAMLIPLSATLVYITTIRHEEKFLETKFGDEYREYKQKVRRWI